MTDVIKEDTIIENLKQVYDQKYLLIFMIWDLSII